MNQSRDSLPSPETLLQGYHVAGWICFATAFVGLPLNVYSLRGLGVIGGMSALSEVENKEKSTRPNGERCIPVAGTGATKEKGAGFEGK